VRRSGRRKRRWTPYENVNLKLFAAMDKLRGRTATGPPIIELVNEYARLFPDEAKRIYELFIETTWGATASQEVAAALQHAPQLAPRDMALFRQERAFPLLDALIVEVAGGKRALDANSDRSCGWPMPGSRLRHPFGIRSGHNL